MQRDHKWLKIRLETIWQQHFSDVAIANNVFVKFGRPSITRLGSIKYGRDAKRHFMERSAFRVKNNPNTIITINGHFKDPEIPEYVVDAVLAHELTHYAHGFFSPHQQHHRYPHQGSVVKNEMKDRGLEKIMKAEKVWIKENWRNYILKHCN